MWIHFRLPATQSARVVPKTFALKLKRAQGMPGAWCARRRMCDGRKQKAHALVRSHRKHPAFPARWFTAYSALSPAIGLFCHRRSASPACRTRRVDIAFPRNLTPASRRQDHTTSPSASRAVRQRRIRVHRIPPHVRDDRETPLRKRRDGGININVSTRASS
jgi:hypothetical protein